MLAACGGGTAAPDAEPQASDAGPDGGTLGDAPPDGPIIDAPSDAPRFDVTCPPLARPAPPVYPTRPDGLAPLDGVAIPFPLGDIVDFDAAARLGKALFWDVQAGGDGATACASCHFAGGADNRLVNTMSPGPNGIFNGNGVTGPGQTATATDTELDDRVGSQGVRARTFTGLASDPGVAADTCTAATSPIFGANRQVTGRNAPSVFGAVFYRELFWDGRAHNVFNGSDPFGTSGNAGDQRVAIGNGGLASQAVGPANNDVEMACSGRGFDGTAGLGAKLLARPPLQHQRVAADDSALGCLSAAPADGLLCAGQPCTYRELIAAAFGPTLAADAENQFARIWGQAIGAYESLLIPDQTPLDKFLRGDAAALTARQQKGLRIFTSAPGEPKADCSTCHAGPELSDATVGFATLRGLLNVDGGDQGFHQIGVRPTTAQQSEDLGRAGLGPNAVSFSVSGSPTDRGSFKTPQLRNLKLTAPYFHNGGKATLETVVGFYAAGGDFATPASQMHSITMTAAEQTALVDFLRDGLTDCRAEHAHAPFDHPALAVPNGPSLPAIGATGDAPCP